MDFNLGESMSFDLIHDEQGRQWDFTEADQRAKARRLIQEIDPHFVVGSPPCTMFSTLMNNWNKHRMSPMVYERQSADQFPGSIEACLGDTTFREFVENLDPSSTERLESFLSNLSSNDYNIRESSIKKVIVKTFLLRLKMYQMKF